MPIIQNQFKLSLKRFQFLIVRNRCKIPLKKPFLKSLIRRYFFQFLTHIFQNLNNKLNYPLLLNSEFHFLLKK